VQHGEVYLLILFIIQLFIKIEYLSTLEADHIEIINWSPFFDASNIYLRAAKFLIEHEDEIEQQQDKAAAQQQLPNLPAPLAVLPLTPS